MFETALEEMAAAGIWYREPERFRDYCRENELNIGDAVPRYISVDRFADLRTELRESNVMVLRTGTGNFALVEGREENLNDYFIYDDDAFANTEQELFIPETSFLQLFAFSMLKRHNDLQETSLLNLGIAAGVFQHALGLDKDFQGTAPANTHGQYEFEIRPRHDDALTWEHSGQVEIDALFSGKRKGKPVLVIVESKSDRDTGSREKRTLAKHKLAYPYLALRQQVPPTMEVILVYLRAYRPEDDLIHFKMAECGFGHGENAIDSLVPISTRHITLSL